MIASSPNQPEIAMLTFTITDISDRFSYYTDDVTLMLDFNGITIDVENVVSELPAVDQDDLKRVLFSLTTGAYHEDNEELMSDEQQERYDSWGDFYDAEPEEAKKLLAVQAEMVKDFCADELPNSALWPYIMKALNIQLIVKFVDAHIPSEDDISVEDEDECNVPSEAARFFAKMLHKKLQHAGITYEDIRWNVDANAHQDHIMKLALNEI